MSVLTRYVIRASHAIEANDLGVFQYLLTKHLNAMRRNLPEILKDVVHHRRRNFLEVMDEFHLLDNITFEDSKFQGWHPVHDAVRIGNSEWVKLLLEYKIFGAKSKFPLIYYTILWSKLRQDPQNDIMILDAVINNGEDINVFYDGETPIFYAAKEQLWHCVNILLKHKAKIDTYCGDKTARMIIEELNPQLLRSLTAPDARFQLTEALLQGNEEKCVSILEQEPSLGNEDDDHGTTVLTLAITASMSKVVTKILDIGVDPNIDKRNRPIPPVITAIKYGQRDLFNKILYHKAINLLIIYKGNNTVYHILAREWRHITKNCKIVALECIGELFQAAFSCGVDILAKNSKGHSAINLACKSCDQQLLKCFFKYGALPSLNEVGLKKIPPEYINNYLDECITPHLKREYDKDYVDVDFSFVDASVVCDLNKAKKSCVTTQVEDNISYLSDHSSTLYMNQDFDNLGLTDNSKKYNFLSEMNLLHLLTTSKEHVNLLKHPVITILLYLKWKKILRFYCINFIVYFLFTVFLSTYIYFLGEECFRHNRTQSNNTNTISNIDNCTKSEKSKLFCSLTFAFWVIILAREFLQFLFSMKNYFCYKENYLELTLLCAVGCLIVVEPNREVALISIILAYIELTLLIARYPYTSTYLSIFIQVSKNSLGLLCIFCPIIFAFSLGFHAALLKSGDLGIAIFKSLIMLTGEIEADDFNLTSEFSVRLICVIFFIFIVIVFSNVLNALAISDTQLIIDKAELLSCIKKVETYSKFEKTWLKYFCYDNRFPANNVIELLVQKICQLTFSKRHWFRINACPLRYCYDTGSHYKLLMGNKSVSTMSRLAQKYIFGFDNKSISKKLIKAAQMKTNISNNSNGEYTTSTKSLNAFTAGEMHEMKSDLECRITVLEVKLDQITNILLSMQQQYIKH